MLPASALRLLGDVAGTVVLPEAERYIVRDVARAVAEAPWLAGSPQISQFSFESLRLYPS